MPIVRMHVSLRDRYDKLKGRIIIPENMFKPLRNFIVFGKPMITGIVFTPEAASPSVSRISNTTELMNTNVKKKIITMRVATSTLDELEETGRNAGVDAHANAIIRFLTKGISFNRLYLNSFGSHAMLYKIPQMSGIADINAVFTP